jgi:hypothetical protein
MADQHEELMRALTGEAEHRPVWPFMLLAIPIAAIWAFVSAPNGLPPWGGTIAGRANQIAHITGVSLIPAVITWVAFHLLVFSRRASFTTSLKMLGILVLAAVAVPTTALLLVSP